jgi:hypothetical protein
MGTFTFQTGIAEDSPQFGTFVFGDDAEAGVSITHGRAQFDSLEAGIGELLDGSGKVLADHGSDRIGLAPDGHVQGIRAEVRSTCGEESRGGGTGAGLPEKRSSRD